MSFLNAVRPIAGIVLAGACLAASGAERADRQSLRDRFLDTLVFALADDTRFVRLSGRDATPAERAALRRAVAAMFEDDVVLDALFVDGQPRFRKRHDMGEAFAAAVLARLPVVENQLDDEALDALESGVAPDDARASCLALDAGTPLFGFTARERTAETISVLAAGWESLNRGDAAPALRADDLRRATPRFEDDPVLRVAVGTLNGGDPATRCDAAVAVRRAVGAFPKAERVAIYRSWLLSASTVAIKGDPTTAPVAVATREPVLHARRRILRFADVTVDLDDSASVAAAFGLPPASPLAPHIQALGDALAANRTMTRRFDEALDGGHPPTLAEFVDESGNAAGLLLVYGANRLDDRVLVRMRPILRRIAAAQTDHDCENIARAASFPLRQTNLSVDESIVMLDAWARSVDAINRDLPTVRPSDDDITVASVKAMALLGEQDVATLRTLAPGAPVTECEGVRAVFGMQLAEVRGDVALVRQYVDAVRSLMEAPRVYAPGDALATPRDGALALVHGTQTVRFEVDESGRVTRSWVVAAEFEPAAIDLPDGTTTATAPIYAREVDAWLRSRVYKPKFTEGKPVPTVFEMPFTWRIQ